MKTSIIILAYNKLEYTQLCLESIKRYTPENSYEIIVVDNNSTDGTADWLKDQSNIQVIYNKENVGFPKGCNQGIEIATGENILLLNNDTIVTNNWLSNLVKSLYSSKEIGAVGAITNNCSYYQSISVQYQTIDEMQQFALNYNQSNPEKWEERLKLIGFCMLIKREVVDKIGLLDEIFTPGNFEDDDYSLRIRKAGYKLFLCKDTFIHHFGSTSFKENPSKYLTLLKTNEKKFEKKWGFNPTYSSNIRLDIIEMINEPKEKDITVLEVGCACGGTLLKIKNMFKNTKTFGIELNNNSADVAKLVARVSADNIENGPLNYSEGFFDYIIFADVLEHLYDPWKVLKNISKYLKEDGKILASIPNIMHFSVLKEIIKGHFSYTDAGILDRTHIRFFTFNEINKMFQETGYKNLEFKTINLPARNEDERFIEHLCSFSNKEMTVQYNAYQYLVKASIKDELKEIICAIENKKDVEGNIKELKNFKINQIIATIDKDVEKKEEMLQQLAKVNFEMGNYDNVLPYLIRAYEINSKNPDTLFNLAYVLNFAGEKELALKYLGEMENFDQSAASLSEEIKASLIEKKHKENEKEELKYILRRIENDIDKENGIETLMKMLSKNETNCAEIIEITKNSMVEKDNLLNIIATSCYQYKQYEDVIPLLQAAYEINHSNKDTLYNLGLILFELGEYKMAFNFLEKGDFQDKGALELIEKIKGALANE